jgi:CRISPR-associated protein Cmr1
VTSWAGQDSARVEHPEVKAPVGAHLYLGYGPLKFEQGQTALKARAINSGEEGLLHLAFPSGTEGERLDTALWLMHHYGTLGGRSRNGWGSFNLTPADDGTPAFDELLDPRLTAPWQVALKLDWPHAIGAGDGKPLIWQTETMPDWKTVMRRLAELKIGLRTQRQFVFTTGRDAPHPEARHWLSHPVTNHNVGAWRERAKGEFRLPNSLRFKVRAEADGGLRGVIFHVPCLPPAQFKPNLAAIESVWRQVHAHLDHADRKLTRIPA